MSPHSPVNPHFVTELVHRMRGQSSVAAPASSGESLDNGLDDDCRDVEFTPPTMNGAGPLMAPLLPIQQA
jgi:hypothetical protein